VSKIATKLFPVAVKNLWSSVIQMNVFCAGTSLLLKCTLYGICYLTSTITCD